MKSIYRVGLMGGAAGLSVVLCAASAQAQGAPPVATQPDNSSTMSATPAGGATPVADIAQSPKAVMAPQRSGVQDIVVTAQRKTERLQDVPIAVTAVGGAQLTQRGISLSNDLPALVPGLTFVTTGGAGTVYLRGVGSNAGNPNDEPSVATYVDGVYIASSYGNTMDLANLERVEVLKGPQGTLFGRNATGGVIQYITRDPQHTPILQAKGGYSNYDTYSGSLYVSTGITDDLAVDVAAEGSKQNHGWGYNDVRHADTYLTKNWSVRSKILFQPADGFKMVLAGDYQYLNSNTSDYRLPAGKLGVDGVPSPAKGYDTRGNITLDGIGAPRVISKQGGVSLTTEADVDFARLVNIASFRQNTGVYDAEADATPIPFVEAKLPIYQQNISEELQLLSKRGSVIDWTVGAYYFSNTAGYKNYTFAGLAFGTPAGASYGELQSNAMEKTESISGYGQATAEIVHGLKLTGGIRYTDEHQVSKVTVFGAPVPDGHKSFKKPTWRVALDYSFTTDIHGYVSYNRGVKGGGFDLLTPGSKGFDPETLDAYEVGIKSKLFNNMLRFNVAGFYYDYKNIQVQVIPAGTAGIVQTTNAASAHLKGVDADFEFVPVRNLSFSGGFAYVDGKYKKFENTVSYPASPFDGVAITDYDASGNRTVRTPKFTGNLTASYKIESGIGDFAPSITASHNSGFFFSADNKTRQSSYTLLNASIGWTAPNGRYGVTAWGNNLTKEYYLNQSVPSALGDLTAPAAPRTYGVTFNVKLGG